MCQMQDQNDFICIEAYQTSSHLKPYELNKKRDINTNSYF